MKLLKAHWIPLLLTLVILVVVANSFFTKATKNNESPSSYNSYNNEWTAPDENTIPNNELGELIRYGKELFASTSTYLGPKGLVTSVSNGMNCQNCHISAGTQAFGNCLSAVASTYPKYRERSGRVESIEFRINDCLLRSLNGRTIDSLSKEMRAMVAYLQWLGKDVPKGVKPVGAGIKPLPFLTRAADIAKGENVYVQKCASCHQADGAGVLSPDATNFIYPPLWGANSYNTGAGLYRLSQFAAYVKYNMPFGATYDNPQLTDEEAWDVAAYVNTQPRPQKKFSGDWPDIAKKPIDFPYGPYADQLSERQHKYGPFIITKQTEKVHQ